MQYTTKGSVSISYSRYIYPQPDCNLAYTLIWQKPLLLSKPCAALLFDGCFLNQSSDSGYDMTGWTCLKYVFPSQWAMHWSQVNGRRPPGAIKTSFEQRALQYRLLGLSATCCPSTMGTTAPAGSGGEGSQDEGKPSHRNSAACGSICGGRLWAGPAVGRPRPIAASERARLGRAFIAAIAVSRPGRRDAPAEVVGGGLAANRARS